MYNVAIIGAGPAGIFTALEIVKLKPEWKVVLIEKGARIEKRVCLLREGYKSCPSCKTCGLLCGWGGAGAFSDGKLTLTPDVGGHLVDYMSFSDVENLIQYCDDIYLEHGATEVVYGRNRSEFADIERAATLAELKLVHSPVRHLGTEKSLHVLKHMQDYLEDKIEIINNKTVDKLDIENNKIKGFTLSDGTKIDAEYVVVAPGREGADWFSKELIKNGVELINNAVDVGVRVELPAAVMEPITSRLYESKLIYYSPTFGDEVRTFCMNPNGEVVSENYNGIQTVNGHSYADKKTQNTNFALLVSKKFTEPFKEPITYGQHVASLANMGDLSLVLPYRQLLSIIEMLYALDKIAPGVASRYTLLYGVEVKFYSARPKLTNELESKEIKNLFAIGDGAGVTRGLMQASASGVHCARVMASR